MYQQYIEIGYIYDAFQLDGLVKAKMDVQDIEAYRKRKNVFLAKRGVPPVLHSVEKWTVRSEKEVILSLVGVRNRNDAESLIGTTLFIHESELPPLPNDQFYYFEVVGFAVHDDVLGALGTVKEIIEMPAQDLLVMVYKGREVFIPMTFEIVKRADKSLKVIYTCLPDGLLEVYVD